MTDTLIWAGLHSDGVLDEQVENGHAQGSDICRIETSGRKVQSPIDTAEQVGKRGEYVLPEVTRGQERRRYSGWPGL